jgi:hypothetical protein
MLSEWTPRRTAHLFALANIGFLGVDIGIAHLANAFAHRVEWAPVWFSGVATLLLMPGVLRPQAAIAALLDRVVAFTAVSVGVLGMILHLQSGFFATQTLHNLVYSAPFVAPLSYVGIGCILLLLHSRDGHGPAFGAWLLVLTLGGFVGNFALALLDHEQNGFFHPSEWIPVGAAALAIGYLVVELARPGELPRLFAVAVLASQVTVALAGFALHLRVDLSAIAERPIDRIVFGAPVFAPLLFANLALLAVIGLWARGRDDAHVAEVER